jgi:hypothetical protein
MFVTNVEKNADDEKTRYFSAMFAAAQSMGISR